MYKDTITLFNRYVDSFGMTKWYPHVISGVNVTNDKSVISSKYGETSKDNVVLNVRYDIVEDKIMIGDKFYLPPKEWERQPNENLPYTITFTYGNEFDFFVFGDYGNEEVINDDNDTFYREIQKDYDYVFAVTSVAEYSVIPHFEILGK